MSTISREELLDLVETSTSPAVRRSAADALYSMGKVDGMEVMLTKLKPDPSPPARELGAA